MSTDNKPWHGSFLFILIRIFKKNSNKIRNQPTVEELRDTFVWVVRPVLLRNLTQ